MGYLYYGSDTQAISMPDRMLAHVKVLAATKLRRNESFTITWRHTDDEAPGRTTLWLHPAIPLRFTFSTVDAEKIDGPLLQRLAAEARLLWRPQSRRAHVRGFRGSRCSTGTGTRPRLTPQRSRRRDRWRRAP